MTASEPIPTEIFSVLTVYGRDELRAQRAALEAGVLSFVQEGKIVVAYAPGRWLSFHRLTDNLGGYTTDAK